MSLLLPPLSGLFTEQVLAAEGAGVCQHHKEHDADCGYAPPSEGTPCTHEHDEDCGYVAPTEGSPCTHQHDETCGYAPGTEGTPCDMGCTETDEAENIVHGDGCAYTPAVEGTPCTHEHGEDCGYSAPSEGSPCTHEHGEDCGYAAPSEGLPCTFRCDKCVLDWHWVDEDELLVWSGDAKLWGLGIPGASEEDPVTRDMLTALLPQAVTAATAAGDQTLDLTWDLSALPEDGAWEGRYTLTAALPEEHVLTEDAPALEVLLDLGEGETNEETETRGHYPGPVPQVAVQTPNTNPTQKFVSNWSYVAPANAITHTTEHDYSMNVLLDLASYTDKDALIKAIKAALPEKIDCNGTFWSGNYSSFTNAGLVYEKHEGNQVYGKVDISWDFSKDPILNSTTTYPLPNNTTLQLYADPVSNSGYLLRVNTNDPDYDDSNGDEADTAEAYDILNLKVTLKQAATSFPGPVQNVPIEKDANGNSTHKFVSNWSYVLPGGITGLSYDASTNTYSATLALPPDRMTVDGVKAALPKEISCWGYYSDDLQKAGFTLDSSVDKDGQGRNKGTVDITWELKDSGAVTDPVPNGKELAFYAKPISNSGYLLRINTNCYDAKDKTGYIDTTNDPADTAEADDILNLTVTVREFNISDHIVSPASPENVTVNLFDYWVADYGKSPTSAKTAENPDGGDILPKTDWHKNTTGLPVARTGVADWNKGINVGRLLLFGDGLIHAGLWNKGAGAITGYGADHAGMQDLVKPLLQDGYPVVNTELHDKQFDDYRGITDWELSGEYLASNDPATDHTNPAEHNSTEPKNISKIVYDAWQNSHNTASLDYLFDPSVTHNYKTSYKNVTGLFQLDKDGYYYYNMRENFAEFENKNVTDEQGAVTSNGKFVLYDAPATVRTDGKNSIGNFFPFNTAQQVFNGLSADGKTLSSTVACSGNEMNHHLGMTVNVDFRQPANGTINSGSNAQNMTFQFSGDDDVWVFIDDVLVLDMGGIHSEVYGIIDFATGDVYVGRSYQTNGIPAYTPGTQPANCVTHTNLYAQYHAAGKDGATKWTTNPETQKTTFASNTSHTLKMFYLERGNYDSSLALRFNLQPLLYQQIKKVDQNGDPVGGVQFELYEAERHETKVDNAIECLYTDDSNTGNYKKFYVKQKNDNLLVTLTTKDDGSAQFITKDGYFNFADRGGAYYILKETKAPEGYREQPEAIVLHYDPATSMLSVANRWTTGAYACSVSNITGPSSNNEGQKDGLVVAVPILTRKEDGQRLALYGNNLSGFHSVPASSDKDESAILLAALKQIQGGYAHWHLSWDDANSRLYGTLSDLPGLASRYKLNNPNGDMHMTYGLISAEALSKVGITNKGTAKERYEALRTHLKTKDPEEVRDTLRSGFSTLGTSAFNREFRSLIYIPNERRELRVLKIDQNGKPLMGAEFGLFTDKDGNSPVKIDNHDVIGTTGENGMLIFSPEKNKTTEIEEKAGYAKMVWAKSSDTQYYLKETKAPDGHTLNGTVIPVVVGTYGIYADACGEGDGVSVVADVGRLTQTMRQYAMGGDVDITLQDLTATMQVQDSGNFDLNGWRYATLDGTAVRRTMNLHYEKNQFVDYGLHDEDGGANIHPFFVTDTGFVRTQVRQNQDTSRYETHPSSTNKDKLGDTDLTNLFSLLNMVVVTDKITPDPTPGTGKLTISKKLTGSGLTEADYTKLFSFTVELADENGVPLTGEYEYRFYGKDKAGFISSGKNTLLLHHDDSVTILGLPAGTRFTVTEKQESGWHVTPASGRYTGTIDKDGNFQADFTNSKDPNQPPDPTDPPGPSGGGISVTVKKVWVLDDGGKMPESVTVGLFQKEKQGDKEKQIAKVELNAKNKWTHTWNDLSKNYIWTVKELDVPDGFISTVSTSTVSKGDELDFTITNDDVPETPPPGKAEVTVRKVWVLDDGGELPESVTVGLFQNGTQLETVELNAGSGWSHTWKELDGGSTWTVEELDVPDGFISTVSQGSGLDFTITNDDIPETPPPGPGETSVTVRKVWVLNNGGQPAESVTAVLYRNGERYAAAELSGGNGWTYTWSGLDSGSVWRVSELSVPAGFKGYVSQGDGLIFTLYNVDGPEIPPHDPDEPLFSIDVDIPLAWMDGPDPAIPIIPTVPTIPTIPIDLIDPADPTGPGSQTETDIPSIPQTGTNWWPVWLLAAAGAVLILAGAAEKRKGKHGS